jgi:AraC family transcriptional activator of mtrCDE
MILLSSNLSFTGIGLFADPARPWKLPELADLCSMSRATFMRHFQDELGRSAIALLTDIRMSQAADELRKPGMTTAGVAESVGYQSEAASGVRLPSGWE